MHQKVALAWSVEDRHGLLAWTTRSVYPAELHSSVHVEGVRFLGVQKHSSTVP
jgi:hypothetical protein